MCSIVSLLPLATLVASVHEQLTQLPTGWEDSDVAVSSGDAIQLQVALAYSNLDQLEPRLKDVSTPGSASYGRYLDVEEVNNLFAPSEAAILAVKEWLKQSGISEINCNGHTVSFRTTIGIANNLLDTEFKLYRSNIEHTLRTTQYTIPDDLAQYVDFISPTTYFGGPNSQHMVSYPTSSGSDTASEVGPWQTSCLKSITIENKFKNRTRTLDLISPMCLRKMYNIDDYKADPKSGSTIAFGNFLNESVTYADLAQFERIFNISAQNFSVLAFPNGDAFGDNSNPETLRHLEANLDVQTIVGLVGGLPIGAYYTSGLAPFQPDLLGPNISANQNEPFLQFYHYLLSQPNSNLPWVITNSYGDHENTVPEYYAKRVCNMIGMMGLRGRTILESTGDEGVGAVCLANGLDGPPQFTAYFPATCPYITAVGGTAFLNPVTAWNRSSGGFSNYFPTAWYQAEAVRTYLDNYISEDTKDYYSSNNYSDFRGRAVPDIAAHSGYPEYLTVNNSTLGPIGGTSAAAPVVGAIVALLNDARFRAGQPAIGFANPWLYNISSTAVTDIVLGGSVGCQGHNLQTHKALNGAGIIRYASWNATVGWDPVTGLGTPNFAAMKAAACNFSGDIGN
ncbi:Tripeptidyl-peptidase sed4, partial [Pseudocercospora fuligena]